MYSWKLLRKLKWQVPGEPLAARRLRNTGVERSEVKHWMWWQLGCWSKEWGEQLGAWAEFVFGELHYDEGLCLGCHLEVTWAACILVCGGPDRRQHVLYILTHTFPPRTWLPLVTTLGPSDPVLSPVILKSFVFCLVAIFQLLWLSDTFYPVDMVRQVFCMYHSVHTACSYLWLPTFRCTRLHSYAQSWRSGQALHANYITRFL